MQSLASPDQETWFLHIDPGQRISVRTPTHWRIENDDQTLLSLRAPDDVLTCLRIQYVSLTERGFNDRVVELCKAEKSYWQPQKLQRLELANLEAFEAHFLMHGPAFSCILRKAYVCAGTGVFAVAFMTRAAAWAGNGGLYRSVINSIHIDLGDDTRISTGKSIRSNCINTATDPVAQAQ